PLPRSALCASANFYVGNVVYAAGSASAVVSWLETPDMLDPRPTCPGGRVRPCSSTLEESCHFRSRALHRLRTLLDRDRVRIDRAESHCRSRLLVEVFRNRLGDGLCRRFRCIARVELSDRRELG